MSGMLLSCANMPIIKQIADLLGVVMNAIYFVFDKIGIANIGLCIIIFTLIAKLLVIPMTIKQQKTTKLSSLINSIMAMNAEQKAVYEKYGTSPTGGCMPMLLQMCILLAVYGVVSNIPSHIGAVEDLYKEASQYIAESIDEYDDLNRLNQLMVDNGIEGFEKQENYDKIIAAYYDDSSDTVVADIYNILSDPYARQNAKLDTSKDAWDDMKELKDTAGKIVESLSKVSDADWEKVIKSDLNTYNQKLVDEYSTYSEAQYSKIVSDAAANYEAMENKHEEISDIYSFAGIDLSRSPSQEMDAGIWWAILIPILSALAQWYSTHMTTKNQPDLGDNPMASSMKTMNIIFPLMSAFFCYSFAAGLGLYWVIGSVFQIGQQLFINSYFKKVEVEDIIKSNIEKANKKRAKQGLPPQKITATANTNVRNIKVNTNNSANVNSKANNTNTASEVTYKKGGIAAKANMVKQYNDKNTK